MRISPNPHWGCQMRISPNPGCLRMSDEDLSQPRPFEDVRWGSLPTHTEDARWGSLPTHTEDARWGSLPTHTEDAGWGSLPTHTEDAGWGSLPTHTEDVRWGSLPTQAVWRCQMRISPNPDCLCMSDEDLSQPTLRTSDDLSQPRGCEIISPNSHWGCQVRISPNPHWGYQMRIFPNPDCLRMSGEDLSQPTLRMSLWPDVWGCHCDPMFEAVTVTRCLRMSLWPDVWGCHCDPMFVQEFNGTSPASTCQSWTRQANYPVLFQNSLLSANKFERKWIKLVSIYVSLWP